jgi:hypothetical protein
LAKPIERYPKGARLPYGYYALHNYGIPYRPKDKPVQEDWESVAEKFDVGVKELIYFNFLTVVPDEVNWYLSHYVGCVKVSPSGNNWMFSNNARPGYIFIPPADTSYIGFEPEESCSWMPSNIQQFMLRLVAVAQTVPGYRGQRIRKLVRVIVQAGYPAANELWYYNDMVIREYVDLKTGNAKRRDMTKATGGAFPFDGDSGLYGQSGRPEHHRGKWRIHAVKDLFEDFACGHWDADKLRDSLVDIDDEMYKGWHEMDMVAAKTSQGGGSAFGPLVEDFINHVIFLSQQDNHLYSAFP